MSFFPTPEAGGDFTALVARFTDFRASLDRLVTPDDERAAPVLAGLDAWAHCMACAQEAAGYAPETDRFLARVWNDRLVQIVGDARAALARLGPADAPVSMSRHDSRIPLPGIPKPAPKPTARSTRHRASNSRGRRR